MMAAKFAQTALAAAGGEGEDAEHLLARQCHLSYNEHDDKEEAARGHAEDYLASSVDDLRTRPARCEYEASASRVKFAAACRTHPAILANIPLDFAPLAARAEWHRIDNTRNWPASRGENFAIFHIEHSAQRERRGENSIGGTRMAGSAGLQADVAPAQWRRSPPARVSSLTSSAARVAPANGTSRSRL